MCGSCGDKPGLYYTDFRGTRLRGPHKPFKETYLEVNLARGSGVSQGENTLRPIVFSSLCGMRIYIVYS